MLSGNPRHPVNLTAAVELGRLIGGPGSAKVHSSENLTFTIHDAASLATVAERAETDILYVIIAGYGVLRCTDGEYIEFTAGDVMFVPAGALHCFEQVAPKFKIWRIEVGHPTGTVVEEEGPAQSST